VEDRRARVRRSAQRGAARRRRGRRAGRPRLRRDRRPARRSGRCWPAARARARRVSGETEAHPIDHVRRTPPGPLPGRRGRPRGPTRGLRVQLPRTCGDPGVQGTSASGGLRRDRPEPLSAAGRHADAPAAGWSCPGRAVALRPLPAGPPVRRGGLLRGVRRQLLRRERQGPEPRRHGRGILPGALRRGPPRPRPRSCPARSTSGPSPRSRPCGRSIRGRSASSRSVPTARHSPTRRRSRSRSRRQVAARSPGPSSRPRPSRRAATSSPPSARATRRTTIRPGTAHHRG